MSISLADIAICIELTKWMLDHFFRRVHSAHVKYVQLGRDVESLLGAMDNLSVSFRRATDCLHQLDVSDSSDGSQQQLERESGELMGGLRETIRECENILIRHIKYRYNNSGFIANMRWSATTERRVEQLRSDIQFHHLKIQLLIKPIELTIQTHIAFGIEEILAILRKQFGLAENREIDPIPNWLADRFLRALETNPPEGYTTLEHFPLKEGFDCLYYHVWKSTVSPSQTEGSGRTIEQYLSFLKARWILDILKQGAPFRGARRGSLYPPSILRLEKQIMLEYERIDANQFRETDLRMLNQSAFLIWCEKPPVTPPSLTEPRLSEREVLRLQLPRETGVAREELIIFRRGPTVLRLARNIFPSNSDMPRQESEKIDTHVDALVPWYVIQSQPLIETGGTLYHFQTEEDLFSFQRAVTGYKPVLDMGDVKWTLHKKKRLRRVEPLKGIARVQIWSYSPLDKMSLHNLETDGPHLGSTESSSLEQASSSSCQSHAILATLVDGARGFMISSTDGNGKDALLALKNVPLPVVMIYTRLGGQHTMLHLQVSDKLEVDEAKCECKRAPETCKDAVLWNPRSSITVRSVSAMDDELDSWNLSYFSDPIHPHFNDDHRVQKLECRVLHLRFPEVEDKDHFKSHIQLAKALHKDAQQGNREVISRAIYFSERSRRSSSSRFATNSTLFRSSSSAQQSASLMDDDTEWSNTPTNILAHRQGQTTSRNNGSTDGVSAEPALARDAHGLRLDGYRRQHVASENGPAIQRFSSPQLSRRDSTSRRTLPTSFPTMTDSQRRHSQPSPRTSTFMELPRNFIRQRDTLSSQGGNCFPRPERASTFTDPGNSSHSTRSAPGRRRSSRTSQASLPSHMNTSRTIQEVIPQQPETPQSCPHVSPEVINGRGSSRRSHFSTVSASTSNIRRPSLASSFSTFSANSDGALWQFSPRTTPQSSADLSPLEFQPSDCDNCQDAR